MNIAIIPARKNSKRLSNKNLLKINNKTLIDITIEAAEKSGIFDRIIFSSDIKHIFKCLEKNYPYLEISERSKKLRGDNVKTDTVIRDLIKKLKFSKNDIIFILQPTSPLRKSKHIKEGYKLFKKEKKSVISFYSIINKGSIFEKKGKKIKLSNYNEILIQNGALYIFSVKNFLKNNGIPEICVPYIMSQYESVDIDIKEDYLVSKCLSKCKLYY